LGRGLNLRQKAGKALFFGFDGAVSDRLCAPPIGVKTQSGLEITC
jgi:hypothetical protein